jgi:calcium permeable stress-gated cation channel
VLILLLVIFTALYHVSLNSALEPLIKYLPKTLDAEERQSLLEAGAIDDGESGLKNGEASTAVRRATRPPHPKPNMLTKFLKPHIYNDYATMRRLVPSMVPDSDDIDEGLIRDAYLPPSVWDELPTLLVPRDQLGVSAQEVAHTSKITRITDTAAMLDDKNKIVVNDDAMSSAYFDEKPQKFKNMGFLSTALIAG